MTQIPVIRRADFTNAYVILRRKGWTFASQGMGYIVVNPAGEVVVEDMHKPRVEAEFKRLTGRK